MRRTFRTDSLSNIQRNSPSFPFSTAHLERQIPFSSFVLCHSQAFPSASVESQSRWLSPATGAIITLNRVSHSFYLEETLPLRKTVLWNWNLETPVLKLVRSGHFKGQNFGENDLKFILAFLSHGRTLKVTETWACFWITFPSQMEIVPTQSRINVYFFFFSKLYFWRILEGILGFVARVACV